MLHGGLAAKEVAHDTKQVIGPMKRWLSLFAFLLLFVGVTMAQRNMQDVIYLKNGGVIRGLIIEQTPGISLKIQTGDGSVFVYKMEEIEKMSKEMGKARVNNYGDGYGYSEWNHKEPVVSWLLSFLIPGVGQMYNGQAGKGVGMLLGYSGSIAAIALADDPDITPIIGVAALGIWIWSMVDAPLYASRRNREAGFAFNLSNKSQLALCPSVDYLSIPNETGNRSLSTGMKLSLSF